MVIFVFLTVRLFLLICLFIYIQFSTDGVCYIDLFVSVYLKLVKEEFGLQKLHTLYFMLSYIYSNNTRDCPKMFQYLG